MGLPSFSKGCLFVVKRLTDDCEGGHFKVGMRGVMIVVSFTTRNITPTRNFYVWGAMLHRYEQLSPRPRDIEQLKVALQRIWDDLPLEEIQAAVFSVRKRLSACIKAEGGHFEHLLP